MKPLQLLVATAALLVTAASGNESAEAQSGAQCAVKGAGIMPANLEIYDSATGGAAIAKFTGGSITVTVSDFPADPKQGRVAVATGSGTGGFAINGYTDASKLPMFTAHDVPVLTGHIWISGQRRVYVVASSPGKLRAEIRVTTPMNQNFSGWAACSDFTLTEGTPSGWSPAGRERGFVMKKDTAELYDDPGSDRNVITTLIRSSENGILLWSNERRGAFVHVQYHGEVILDAWARAQDLTALPPGETMDQTHGPVTQANAPHLALQSNPKIVRTTKEIAIRVEAKDSAKVVGHIETGAETYVLDVMAGWASVLPKSLNINAAGEKQFWVKASDLGL